MLEHGLILNVNNSRKQDKHQHQCWTKKMTWKKLFRKFKLCYSPCKKKFDKLNCKIDSLLLKKIKHQEFETHFVILYLFSRPIFVSFCPFLMPNITKENEAAKESIQVNDVQCVLLFSISLKMDAIHYIYPCLVLVIYNIQGALLYQNIDKVTKILIFTIIGY